MASQDSTPALTIHADESMTVLAVDTSQAEGCQFMREALAGLCAGATPLPPERPLETLEEAFARIDREMAGKFRHGAPLSSNSSREAA